MMNLSIVTIVVLSALICSSLSSTEKRSPLKWLKTESDQVGDEVISCGRYQSDACNCVSYARDRQPSLPKVF